ncbi:hypothetical protein MKQ70_34745 [Chitinophaga sedimenti]|nr:hypothetical protein [Chitinophaga sedimenti]MCK7559824.1 hypothetical protein [Chitinophaga sedimenti]
MEKQNPLSRRAFVKNSLVLSAGLPVVSAFGANAFTASAVPAVPLHWLDGTAPATGAGVTWGVPWPRGVIKKTNSF